MKQQDAIGLLKADHKTVKGLFKEAEELSDRAKVQLKRLGDRICRELQIHDQLEMQIFYPAIKERSGRNFKDERDLVFEGEEEHALVRHVIGDLQGLDASDETYKPKLKTLKELVEDHVKEEERDLFPGVRDMFDEDELVALGTRMAELKSQQQTALNAR